MLKASDVITLRDTFTKKNWPIDSDNQLSEFGRFCEMFQSLDEEQKIMVLELTQEFTWVRHNEYWSVLKPLLQSYLRENPLIEEIIVLPLLAKKDYDRGLNKSAHQISYLFKGNEIHTLPESASKKISVIDYGKSIVPEKSAYRVLLVDDFVGSGSQAENALAFFLGTYKEIIPERIDIMSLVAQEKGVEKIATLGHKLYCDRIVKKGISDIVEASKKDTYLLLMENIELKMRIDKDYQFGYKRSEALVSMIRTPNNTFPLFWYNKKIAAPFPRYHD